MPLFTPRKTRTSRAITVAVPRTWFGRMESALKDRSVLARLAPCAVALLLFVVVVEAWRSPFRFREGDRPPHGVVARCNFEWINLRKTDRARAEREEKVPFVFRHDPATVAELPERLRRHLSEVAMAGSLEDLTEEVREAFGLVDSTSASDETDARRAASGTSGSQRSDSTSESTAAERFRLLHDAVADDEGLSTVRIEQIVSEFRQLIEPLQMRGVVDSQELRRAEVHSYDHLRIVPADATTGDTGPVVKPSDVLLEELLKDSQSIGRAWSTLPSLAPLRPVLVTWLRSQIEPTLVYDKALTLAERQEARRKIPPVRDVYRAGERLVEPGEAIDAEHLDILRAEHEAVEQSTPWMQKWLRLLSVAALVGVLMVLVGTYVNRHERVLRSSVGQLSIYLASAVLALALARLLSFDPWRAEVIPLVVMAMVLSVAYSQMLATLSVVGLALVLSLSTTGSLAEFVTMVGAAVVAIVPLTKVPSRLTLIKVGLVSGIAYLVIRWGIGMIGQPTVDAAWTDADLLIRGLWGAGCCLAAGYLVAGSLPFVERAFGVVTDISLLEMSDPSHPLLQELVQRAPGTYNHSMTVATIGEAAAERIGANGLLVRVGAYFHDVGKMLKPDYFIENMTDQNNSRHKHLAPAMSKLVIIGHVKDGVDLARQHNLPQRIIDFIEQHHGTTLVGYFYHEARREADSQPDHRTDAEESSFRYPGPKPQSREAAVMMLADAVESASRTLSDPTPKRIERLVHEIAMDRLMDGQFDESSLTLTELHAIEESLVKSLTGIYHGRIKYPEQQIA